MSYNIGLSKKENPPKSVLKVGNLDDSDQMKFRLELGFSYSLPLQDQYNAMATDFYAGWMAFLHNNFYIGGSYESRGLNNGIDKRFIDVFEDEINERLLTRTTGVADKISAIKFYLAKNLSQEKPLDCFIGLGLGLYDIIDAGGYYSEMGGVEINIKPVIEEQINCGPFLRAGIRTGLFTNTLELNMPLGEIPFYVNFKTGIGLNAFSTKED